MKKMKITIDGNEKNKSEIVYNNIVSSMNDSKLTKDEQIDYLKQRLNFIETNLKNKINLGIIISINSILLILGLLFMILDIYLLGISFIIVSFTLIIILICFNKNNRPEITGEYEEIDRLRKNMSSKLK